jgi:glycosyltransferase involved in cell wall biosynthesis
MRICLIGDFRANLDEGYTNVASNLARELAKCHEVTKLNLWHPLSADFWRNIRNGRPQIIHYFTAPNAISFWILKAMAAYWRGPKTIMSVLHPDGLSLDRNIIFRSSIPLLKPDLLLVHVREIESMFTRFGCKTGFLPNGVDVERFHPHSLQSRGKLREKYGIEPGKFIILHVGHIKKDRNVQIFRQVQGGDKQVLIVASTYRGGGDEKLHRELSRSGCIIWKRYFPNIEEIYALADCYLFPSQESGSLLLPLSVMEAMACNLPVISTRFGALPDIFQEGDGLFFFNKVEEFMPLLDKIKTGNVEVNTRQKVLLHTWENIARKLEEIYKELVSADGSQ